LFPSGHSDFSPLTPPLLVVAVHTARPTFLLRTHSHDWNLPSFHHFSLAPTKLPYHKHIAFLKFSGPLGERPYGIQGHHLLPSLLVTPVPYSEPSPFNVFFLSRHFQPFPSPSPLTPPCKVWHGVFISNVRRPTAPDWILWSNWLLCPFSDLVAPPPAFSRFRNFP